MLLSEIVFLKPATIAVEIIIIVILRAIAITANLKIALEKEPLEALLTRFAMKNSKLIVSSK